jgi:protein-tyrosine phosphatase
VSTPFSIVFVCTGNRFRSPLAEAFVRRLTVGLNVDVRSFGLLNLDRSRALPEAVTIGHWCGVDLSAHRTTELGVEQLAATDLLIGFERSHVQRAVVDCGAPAKKSFTLREFRGLVEGLPVPQSLDPLERAYAVVEGASALRGDAASIVRAPSMPDPLGRSWRTYCATAAEIHEFSVWLARSLFGVTDTSGLPPWTADPPRPTDGAGRRVPFSRR